MITGSSLFKKKLFHPWLSAFKLNKSIYSLCFRVRYTIWYLKWNENCLYKADLLNSWCIFKLWRMPEARRRLAVLKDLSSNRSVQECNHMLQSFSIRGPWNFIKQAGSSYALGQLNIGVVHHEIKGHPPTISECTLQSYIILIHSITFLSKC